MNLRELIETSPLGCVGMFLLGGVLSIQFGMAAVFGIEAKLNVGQISSFIAVLYIGAMLFQYPIGWVSDRVARRLLIAMIAALAAVLAFCGILGWHCFPILLTVAFLVVGTINPLYSLLIAYTNDFLDMVAASEWLLFVHGFGAISGSLVVGWMMNQFGPSGFFCDYFSDGRFISLCFVSNDTAKRCCS